MELEQGELTRVTEEALGYMQDEIARSGGSGSSGKQTYNTADISDSDLECLKKRLPFLADFSDDFIRSRPMDSLLKIETTALKIKQMEQSRDHEDRLALNKLALENSSINVLGGPDNRWSQLHRGRFLPGAACSAAKMWLTARGYIGLNSPSPIGSYDMAAVGMGGFVTSRGWLELHNPGSSRISLRMFSINNCGSRAGSSKSSSGMREDDLEEIMELGEFKLAVRALRVAAGFCMPWNMAYVALENFLIQSDFCMKDLAGTDRQAHILTQFVDYVLGENSKRWRDGDPFLDSSALGGAWTAFYGARTQSAIKRTREGAASVSSTMKKKTVHRRKWIDVCFPWNAGKCLKPAGTCVSPSGVPLRHVCNHVADKNKPDNYCGKDHACHAFHKNG